MSAELPAVSVVIPTYNRARLLQGTLDSLTAQRFPGGRLEVVVADDGSSDATAEVVRSFADRLPIHYYFQEDRGFRAGSARNGGARLASGAVVVFLDTGAIAGPGFARAHYDAHQRGLASGRPGWAVLGYAYGFLPQDPYPGLSDLLASHPVEEVVGRLRGNASFLDMRHPQLADCHFDLDHYSTPWELCWSVNLSVRAQDFWAVGGFDEDFTGWGCEDQELGLRLARHGLRFAVGREAWVVETPHDREIGSNHESFLRNLRRMLDKHRQPAVELYTAICTYQVPVSVEREHQALTGWASQARGMDVRAELAAVVEPAAGPVRVAGIGCGSEVPASWPDGCALVDFDRELLDQAATGRPGAAAVHAVGLLTPFPDQSFDVVVISSRLAGLWGRWSEALLAEAYRIGREVRVPLIQLGY